MGDEFKTIGVGINSDLFCANNRWNRFASNLASSKGVMIDLIGNMPKSSNCIPMRVLGKEEGKSPRYDLQMARSTQNELAKMGIVLPSDYYSKHPAVMAAVNTLTGLSYCSVLSRDKDHRTAFLCTKNVDVVKQICRRYGLAFPAEAVRKYKDRLHITEEEIKEGVLKCVRISFKDDGLKLTSGKVHVNSKATTLLPMFMIGFFSDSISKKLGKGICNVNIRRYGEVESIVTSLDKGILSRRTGMDAGFIADKFNSMNDIGVINVYDLRNKGFVSINLLDIISITKRG